MPDIKLIISLKIKDCFISKFEKNPKIRRHMSVTSALTVNGHNHTIYSSGLSNEIKMKHWELKKIGEGLNKMPPLRMNISLIRIPSLTHTYIIMWDFVYWILLFQTYHVINKTDHKMEAHDIWYDVEQRVAPQGLVRLLVDKTFNN